MFSFSVQYCITEKPATLSFCFSLQHPWTFCYSVGCLCNRDHWFDLKKKKRKRKEGRERIKPKFLSMAYQVFLSCPSSLGQSHLPTFPRALFIPGIRHPQSRSFCVLSFFSVPISSFTCGPQPHLSPWLGHNQAPTPSNCGNSHSVLPVKCNWQHTMCISFLGLLQQMTTNMVAGNNRHILSQFRRPEVRKQGVLSVCTF